MAEETVRISKRDGDEGGLVILKCVPHLKIKLTLCLQRKMITFAEPQQLSISTSLSGAMEETYFGNILKYGNSSGLYAFLTQQDLMFEML